MKTTAAALLATVLVAHAPAWCETQATDAAARVEALLEQMTLEEKIGQLNQYSNTFDITGPPAEDHAGRERLKAIRSLSLIHISEPTRLQV